MYNFVNFPAIKPAQIYNICFFFIFLRIFFGEILIGPTFTGKRRFLKKKITISLITKKSNPLSFIINRLNITYNFSIVKILIGSILTIRTNLKTEFA